MLLNSDTVLSLPPNLTILVPYTSAHVPCYHSWMQNPHLLHLTSSEPLSLSEEHSNMQSWRNDPRKLTFIILDATRGSNFMAGDVNLYLLDAENEGVDPPTTVVAELEVMIAEPASRRKGLAKVALRLMMAYARVKLGVEVFLVKVLEENEASLRLFEDAFEFREYRRIKAFGEVHLKLEVNAAVETKLKTVCDGWCVESYKDSPISSIPIDNRVSYAHTPT